MFRIVNLELSVIYESQTILPAIVSDTRKGMGKERKERERTSGIRSPQESRSEQTLSVFDSPSY